MHCATRAARRAALARCPTSTERPRAATVSPSCRRRWRRQQAACKLCLQNCQGSWRRRDQRKRSRRLNETAGTETAATASTTASSVSRCGTAAVSAATAALALAGAMLSIHWGRDKHHAASDG